MNTDLRIGDRVTVTNPTPGHETLHGMRGTVTYLPGDGILVAFDDGDEDILWVDELSGPHTDARLDNRADRILAVLR